MRSFSNGRAGPLLRIVFVLIAVLAIVPSAATGQQPGPVDQITADELTADVVQRIQIKHLAPLQLETDELLARVRALEARFAGPGGNVATATRGSTTGLWLNNKMPPGELNTNHRPQVAIYCQKVPGAGDVAVVGAYGTGNKSHGLTAALVAADQGGIQLVDLDGKAVHLSANQLRQLIKMLDDNIKESAKPTKATEVPSPFSSAPRPFVYNPPQNFELLD